MFVFLSHIPPDVNHQDIIKFVEPVLKKNKLNPFSADGMIEEIKIIGLRDKNLNTVEFHCLLIITPDVIAERVIKLLDNKPLRGKRIKVREYHVRSTQNDPRLKSLTKRMTLKERRKKSRRRCNLVVIKNTDYRPK